MAEERNALQGNIKKENDKAEQSFHEDKEAVSKGIEELSISPDKEVSTIKIATWNVKDFSTKARVPNIKIKLVCDTIIAGKFDIIALQDVGEEEDVLGTENAAIQKLLGMLQASEDTWQLSMSTNNIGIGLQRLPCHGVILWNSKKGLSMEELSGIRNLGFTRIPIIGRFKIGMWKFTLACFHLARGHNEEVRRINDVIAETHDPHGNLILLGTFDTYVSGIFYENLLARNENSNTANATATYDAIIITSWLRRMRYVDHSFGNIITSVDFQASAVSPRRPVWAQFLVFPR